MTAVTGWDFAACAVNFLSLITSICTIIYMIWYKLKNIKLFVLQFVNTLSQSIVIYYFFLNYLTSTNQVLLGRLDDTASTISTISVFIIVLIDCDVLEAFAVLDSKITPFRMKMLRTVMIALFVVLVVPSFFIYLQWLGVNLPDIQIAESIVASIIFEILMVLYGILQW